MTRSRIAQKEMRCPMEYGLDVFGTKWKGRIMCVLSQFQPMRYGDLKRECIDISDAMLSGSLRELLEDGMVAKLGGSAPRAEYALTEKGLGAVPILHAFCRWSKSYHEFPPNATPDVCHTCLFQEETGAAVPAEA